MAQERVMYTEDDLLQLSALQHLLFCERQCALIHIEQAWEENRLTAEGRVLHERVHESGDESRGSVRIVRGLRLRSLRLGLAGMADVVEFRRVDLKSQKTPFPVEYKRGKPKPDDCDLVQLCAQAICLEEMLNCEIPAGALFYGKTRRRLEVEFTEELRLKTAATAERLHKLVEAGVTPPAVYEKKCKACSLFSLCMPENKKSATQYLNSVICDMQSVI